MARKIPLPTPDKPLAPSGVKQATFNQLLDIARQKIELTGSAPSVSDVALLAGVSRATAYRCFPSRAAMLTAVVGASLGPMRTFASDHLDGIDRVMDLFKRSLPRLTKNETSFFFIILPLNLLFNNLKFPSNDFLISSSFKLN